MVTYGVRLKRSDKLRLPLHREATDEANFSTWLKEQSEAGARLAVDLFSGAGGLSLGLESAGWTVAAAIDNEPTALETHRHNFRGLALNSDMASDESREELVSLFDGVKVDLVAGGPPCQPFSRAGRSKIRSLVEAGQRVAMDPRRELWAAYLDVALRLKPRAILMENVPDMGLGDDFRVVRSMVDRLEDAGYATEARIIDAWRYGVPQHRRRLLVMARSDSQVFSWPAESKAVTSLRSAIGDLPLLEDMGGRQLPYEGKSELDDFQARMRCGTMPSIIHDHMTRAVREDDREAFALMTSKTLYSDLPEHLRRYRADHFDDKYKRLDWDGLSRSITAHIARDGYWYIHPEQHRTLTVREAARIQTFPDRFRFAGSRSDAFRQIGNAVPPLLGEAAARALAPADSPERPEPYWMDARQRLAKWGMKEGKGSYWFLLPGNSVTLPVALATALVIGRRSNMAKVRECLVRLRGLGSVSSEQFLFAYEAVQGTKAGEALQRMRPLVGTSQPWADKVAILQAVPLAPAELEMFSLLSGGDLMLRSSPARRVAARVAGRGAALTNELSDGRLDMARLVGGGDDAPVRMASVQLIGNTLCLARTRNCAACPLRDVCREADQDAAPPLFALDDGQA